jgi:hypothetical protein
MLGVFHFASRFEAACRVLEEDDAAGASAQPVDRACVGELLLHQAQEGVFHEAAAGECGQPAGFVDGQQMKVIEQDFEVLRGLWFAPTRVWPEVTDSLPLAVTPFRVTSALFRFCCQTSGVECG